MHPTTRCNTAGHKSDERPGLLSLLMRNSAELPTQTADSFYHAFRTGPTKDIRLISIFLAGSYYPLQGKTIKH